MVFCFFFPTSFLLFLSLFSFVVISVVSSGCKTEFVQNASDDNFSDEQTLEEGKTMRSERAQAICL